MAYTMSYGVTPAAAPAEPPAKARTAKKPPAHRVRKHNTLQSQAQALFDSAPAAPDETAAAVSTQPESDPA